MNMLTTSQHPAAPALWVLAKATQSITRNKRIKTMKQTAAFLLSGAVILTPVAAHAEDIYAVLPPHKIDNKQTLETTLQTMWSETGRGDSFTVINGQTAETVVSLSIPDQGRYDVQKFKNADFSASLRRLRTFVESANELDAPEAIEWHSDVPEALDRISELRAGSQETGRVLIFGSPLHRVDYNPSLSMITEENEIRVASDGFILADRLASPYGRPDQQGGLSGLDIDFCAVLPSISAHEKSEIMRQWGHIIELRGGRLSSFTTDIQTCLKRFQMRVDDPITLRPLDPDLDPVMIGADMAGQASQITLSAMEELDQARNEALGKIDELEAELQRREGEVQGLTQQRDESQAELDKIKSALGQTEAAKGSEVLDFSKFTSVPHPDLQGLTIITGVSYDDGFPSRYTTAWCYFIKFDNKGAQLQFDVGSKSSGGRIQWEGADRAILAEVGLSSTDFTRARTSCRFPEE